MTNGDRIRAMNDEELAKLLVWRTLGLMEFVPSCDAECEHEGGGCALTCPMERRERAVRKWLAEEN